MPKNDLPLTILRHPSKGARRAIRACYSGNAWQALGKLEPGMELFGFSKGQFSIIQLICACLSQTGPADVTVATWTAAKKEIHSADRLVKSKAIRSLRWLVDFSFPRRQPQFAAMLREYFGDGCIRVTKNHAKFVLIRNDKWNLVLRTSMNMNSNPRFENFEISDDREMADFLEKVVREVFDNATDGEAFDERPIYHVEKFGKFGMDIKAFEPADEALGVCLDDPSRPGLRFER